MKTKDKILQAALALFNEHGVENVSLRRVAKELGISLGNLTYHFAKRDDVVYALYLQLVEKMDPQMVSMEPGHVNMALMGSMLQVTYEGFSEYRFLINDMIQVMRKHPRVRKHYQELCIRRQTEILSLFRALVHAGSMKPEMFPGQFELLAMQMTILSNSFLPSAEMFFRVPPEETQTLFVQVISQAFIPYLTEKGKQEFIR